MWEEIVRRYDGKDLYKYISHKLLRWFGIVPMTLACLFGVAALASAGHAAVIPFVVFLAACAFFLGRVGVPVLAPLSEVALMIIATGIGVAESFRGKTYQTWTPVVSRN
jgi:hypothetical protein